jgi:hypothetical protein
MNCSAHWKRLRLPAGTLILLAAFVVTCQSGTIRAEEAPCVTRERLRKLSPSELHDLFVRSEMGCPLVGIGQGRVLCMTDCKLPRFKTCIANAFWTGKTAEPDGYFINRWICGIQAIDSHYVVGPS